MPDPESASWFASLFAWAKSAWPHVKNFFALRARIAKLEEQVAEHEKKLAQHDRACADCQRQLDEQAKASGNDHPHGKDDGNLVLVGGFWFVVSDAHPRSPTCPVCFGSNPLIRLSRTPDKPARTTRRGLALSAVVGQLSCPGCGASFRVSDAEFSALQGEAQTRSLGQGEPFPEEKP